MDLCPTPGNCFLSADDTCKLCDSKDEIDCAVCADGHYKNGAKCAKCPAELRFCALCSASSICTKCIYGYELVDEECVAVCDITVSNC